GDPLSLFVFALVAHHAVDQREQREVPAHADVLSRVNARAELAHQNIAGAHGLAAENLHAAPLPLAVAAVARAAACFFLNTRTFLARIWPTISPVTLALASSGAPILTSSPPTKSTSGNTTCSPTSPASFSTLTRSPSATRYCLPPVRITAYFIGFSRSNFSKGKTRQSQLKV